MSVSELSILLLQTDFFISKTGEQNLILRTENICSSYFEF